MLLEIDSSSGSLIACSCTPEDETSFYDLIDRFSHMDENLINDLLLFLENRTECPGFLANIRVSSNVRGEGFGRNLIENFQKSIANHTDIDFLIAHTENPQASGFNLLRFYRKYGFEPVIQQDGMVLMANKGWAKTLRREVFPQLVKRNHQQKHLEPS